MRKLLVTYRHREFSNALGDKEFAFIDQLQTPVIFANNALLDSMDRRQLKKLTDTPDKGIVSLPDRTKPGNWSTDYAPQLEEAIQMLKISDSVASKIEAMKSQALRNNYTLEVYEQVNQFTRFAPKALLALKEYDLAQNQEQVLAALKEISDLKTSFQELRKELEKVYGKTRILEKPEGYILDQDHHTHLANQSTNFDWQFYAELLFLEKLEEQIVNSAVAQ